MWGFLSLRINLNTYSRASFVSISYFVANFSAISVLFTILTMYPVLLVLSRRMKKGIGFSCKIKSYEIFLLNLI